MSSQITTMSELREAIDALDRELVLMLKMRQDLIERAGHIKQDRSKIRDEARIQDVLSKVAKEADKIGLSQDIAQAVWHVLIERCIAHEFEIFDEKVNI